MDFKGSLEKNLLRVEGILFQQQQQELAHLSFLAIYPCFWKYHLYILLIVSRNSGVCGLLQRSMFPREENLIYLTPRKTFSYRNHHNYYKKKKNYFIKKKF